MLPKRVVNRINAGPPFDNDVLKGFVDLEDLVHPEHVQEDPPLEGRADSHTDSALGDNRNLVLIGKAQNLGEELSASLGGLYADNHIRKCLEGPIGQRVLIVNLVDGVSRDKARPNDFLELLYNLVQSDH